MRQLVSALLVTLLAAAPLAADRQRLPDPRHPDVPADERLDVLIERVKLAHEDLQTLEADFVQKKESALLLEPSEAVGVFSYAAPDQVRWEYKKPDPISLLIAGEEMTTWYHDLGQAERMHVGRQAQKILEYLGASSSMATLLKYFDAKLATSTDPTRPFRLELLPRYERVARRLTEMTIWLDPDLFLPIGLRYVEADGDVTEYRFENLRVNADMPADRFDLGLPTDVDVREIELDRRAGLE